MISIVEEAGAEVAGIGIAIEKGLRQGGEMIRKKGYHPKSPAIVEAMDADSKTVAFKEQEAKRTEQCSVLF